MTIPTLVQEFRVKTTVTQLKSTYSILSQAFSLAITTNGAPEDWGLNNLYDPATHQRLADYVKVNLKLIRDCAEDSDNTACLGRLNNDSDLKIYGSSFVMANGSTVFLRSWGDCNQNFGEVSSLKKICGTMVIDVNGQKKPNLKGQDVFYLYFSNTGIFPVGTEGDYISFEKNCLRTETANVGFVGVDGCSGWVIYNENMDYLKCKDIGWNKKKTCT